jgi:hypothetical protein
MPFTLRLVYRSGAVRLHKFETAEEAEHVRTLLLQERPVELTLETVGPVTVAPVNLSEIGEVEEVLEVDTDFPRKNDKSTPG